MSIYLKYKNVSSKYFLVKLVNESSQNSFEKVKYSFRNANKLRNSNLKYFTKLHKRNDEVFLITN